MTDLLLERPEAQESFMVTPQNNARIELNFTSENASINREGNNLVFNFADGASIEVTDFYAAYSAENMPEFIVDGSVIAGEAFFEAFNENLMPASGNTNAPSSGGSTVGTEQASLYSGLESTDGLDSNNEPSSTPVNPINERNSEEAPVGDLAMSTTPARTPESNTNPAPEADTSPEPEADMSPTPEVPSVEIPSTTPPAPPTPPAAPTYEALGEIIAADAGASVAGNVFDNDNITDFNPIITAMTGPEGWIQEHTDGNFTFTSPDGDSVMTISADGSYSFVSSVENSGIDELNFTYTATDDNGTESSAQITIGNSLASELVVENLSNDQTEVTAIVRDPLTGEIISENTYIQSHSSYKDDANIGNHRIDGLLLGEGDDTITIAKAQGESSAKPIFIYGDELQGYDAEEMGDDIINIGEMDNTLIRADGNLYAGDVGGNDTVNVEHMNSGSIFGDGWELYDGGKGGDDVINVGTMSGGVIRGDGEALRSTFEGGDDIITVEKIDTNSAADRIIIDGDSGDDFISVGEMDFTDGGFLTVDGGTGHDFFLYDSDADDTVALSNGSWYIAGESFRADNVEGMGTGDGKDLIKLYGSIDEDTDVDGGDGLDALLVNAGNLNNIENMLENGEIVNTEMIVMNSALNNSKTTSQEDLFNKLDGVSQEDGKVSFDESIWNRAESSVDGFDQYSSGDTTILVAKAVMENASGF